MKELNFKNYRLVCNKENGKAELSFYDNSGLVWSIHPSITTDYYPVFKAFGNKVYTDCKRNLTLLSGLSARILDYDILCDCYDSYSDGHKEEYGVRPHLTNEQWRTLVKNTKAEYGI